MNPRPLKPKIKITSFFCDPIASFSYSNNVEIIDILGENNFSQGSNLLHRGSNLTWGSNLLHRGSNF
jgi:hypothetical protein